MIADLRSAVTPDMRVPPHDIEAEKSVIGSLLIDQDAIAAIRDVLNPGDFYAEKHAHIYEAAIALSDRGEPIDTVTLRSELDRHGELGRSGGIDYIAELSMCVPTAVSVKYYADIVADHALRRHLISAGGEVSALGFDVGLTTETALDTAEQRVFRISESRNNTEATHIAPAVKELWQILEQRSNEKRLLSGVATGFRKLDQLTLGLQPGELVVLAARPSVGKTALALNIASHAVIAEREPVAIFSLEMSKQALVQRLLCSEANIDSYLLRTSQLDSNAYQRIAAAMDKLTQAEMWIDDTYALSIASLRARARRMKAQHGIKLIVIDYLQLMRGGRQESRVQEVSDISSGLKSIAKELNIPVLALSQLSRESERRENRRPQLSDLRDSGSIEQDADVVIFLFRPGMHKDDIDKSQTELIVAKNRNGPTDNINLVFVAAQTAFKEPVNYPQPSG